MNSTPAKTISLSPSTEAQYRHSYACLERRAAKTSIILPGEQVTPQQIVATFLLNESQWDPATARVYRASLNYVLQQNFDIANCEALEMLHGVDEDGEWEMQKRDRVKADRQHFNTKAKKKSGNRLSVKNAEHLIKALTDSRSDYSIATSRWVIAAMLTGISPAQWKNTIYTFDDFGQPKLICGFAQEVDNHVPSRSMELSLKSMPLFAVDLITQHMNTVNLYDKSGVYSSFYENCRHLLQRVSKKIWPHRMRQPSLYLSGCAPNDFDKTALDRIIGVIMVAK